ncbi:MAG: glutamate--tRNA ligase [Gammaproteobacteria bacterium]|nr:glutamate--tRNA ligase [Gammaproteobacteria bacterium]MCH9743556.1 glutamate--tRNA ligase [Gammaproteobacteria bacterium]
MTQQHVHIKTRFAPSPTGLVHMGNIRTALFNDLFVKHHKGTFLLRIEDTDRERSKAEYTEQLQQDLQWLELNWQEGPGRDEGNGPYRQSARQSIYDDYYKRLEQAGNVYPCFCSEEELQLMRKVQRASGRPPRYAGTCRNLSDEQIEEKLAAGLNPTLRFAVPENEVIAFEDMVRGSMRFESNDIGDFIVRRTDGTSPFMFCSVIDDALMKVTHVLRGEDHITNTPRQLMILQALGLPEPTYGHIALIVAADGSPLSKRHGSKSVVELREQGYLPIAINNYLARLGHYYGHDNLLSLEQLAEQFKVKSLSKSPAKFNLEQLHYWQKEAVLHADMECLDEWLKDVVADRVPLEHRRTFLDAVHANILFPEDAKLWVAVFFGSLAAFDDEQREMLKEAGAEYFSEALNAYQQHGEDVKSITNHLKEKLGLKGKALFMPLRVALTGQQHGPELVKVMTLLSDDTIRERLQNAKDL